MKNKIASINNCLNCKKAGCNNNCFINTNIKDIINLMKEDKIEEAINLHYNYNSIGFICGILCDHMRGCLGGCNNKKNPVSTNELCYLLGVQRLNLEIHKMKPRNKHVVIIGGGVAGMIAAEKLLEAGFEVSLYEKSNKLGGVLNLVMPEFRYDMSVFNKWEERLKTLGLNVYLNKTVNSLSDIEKFDYLVVATGAGIAKRLYDDKLTVDALKVLEEVKLNKLNFNGLDVVVLGGGNTAYDVARVVNRLGNNVSIAYRRDIKNSPAAIKEVEVAVSEGVKVLECIAPKEITIVGNKKQIRFVKTSLVNDGGTRLNFKETSDEVNITCDVVIEAIGANSDLKFIKENYPSLLNEKGYVTDIENDNIYVIGDAYSGASNFASANLTARECVSKIIEKEKRSVLFGGSFNPPTIAHYEIIKYLSKNYDEVLVLPNGDTYTFAGKVLDSFKHRVNMLYEMVKYLPNVKVLELENEQEFMGTYWTLRTLNHPTFVLGADCLDKLHLWKHFDELMTENNFIVFNRGESNISNMINTNIYLNKFLNKFEIIDLKVPDVSSTEFRKSLNKDIVCKEVYDYIIKNELY
ncbi:MAG: FAD-binding protein [Erysipelotrichaceae bacterium]|nr:FAD-binding protein [Erysipelotrichaceae bacterium]